VAIRAEHRSIDCNGDGVSAAGGFCLAYFSSKVSSVPKRGTVSALEKPGQVPPCNTWKVGLCGTFVGLSCHVSWSGHQGNGKHVHICGAGPQQCSAAGTPDLREISWAKIAA